MLGKLCLVHSIITSHHYIVIFEAVETKKTMTFGIKMEKKNSFLLIPSPFAISNLLQKNLYHVRKDSMDEEREKGGRGMRGGWN